MVRVADRIDVKGIHSRLPVSMWQKAEPLGEDAWTFKGFGSSIIVSIDLDSEPGVEWIHASIAYRMQQRFPSYSDLKMLHHAVFGDGHAYQCFVPPGEHVNLANNVLHLWGRLDGKPVLPNFGRWGTI